jgi:hypothetical protein
MIILIDKWRVNKKFEWNHDGEIQLWCQSYKSNRWYAARGKFFTIYKL